MYRLKNRLNINKSIVLVEDNRSMCRLLTRILESEYTVYPFTSAFDAIDWLSNADFNPDLIATDISMPGMDGFEFARYLKASGLYTNIPLVFISGLDYEDLQPRLLTIDHSLFISKPFRPDELTQRVEAALNLVTA